MLKVLFLSRAHSEAGGGMERLSWELTHELQKQPGLNVQVIAPRRILSHLESTLFALAIIPRALVAARNVGVIHIGDPVLSLAGWLISKLLGKPVVVNIHGLDVSYAHPLYRLYLRLFFRHFAAYIAISRYAKQQLDRWQVRGQVHVIPPGAFAGPAAPAPPPGGRARPAGGGPPSRHPQVALLTVGRLVSRKGQAWFIEHVLPHLPEHVTYIIAGEGPEAANIIQAAENSRVVDRVKLLGRVDEETLRELYQTADAFIQANIKVPGDVEGFGIVLLEAALRELPVFAANVDGIPQAIHDGKNGYLIPIGDAQAWINALQDFLAHPEQYIQRATSARQYTLENFGWERIGKQYVSVIDSLRSKE